MMKKKTRNQSAQRRRRDAKGTRRPKVSKSDAAIGADKTAAAAKASNASTADERPKRRGALAAASEVLKKADKPMRCRGLIETMAERGLWINPKGKTPHATLYAALLREIRDKGGASRFRKVDRGQFALNTNAVNR